MIIAFVSNVHESPHGNVLLCIFLHILHKMNIIVHLNNKNAKNARFIVYFITKRFYVM